MLMGGAAEGRSSSCVVEACGGGERSSLPRPRRVVTLRLGQSGPPRWRYVVGARAYPSRDGTRASREECARAQTAYRGPLAACVKGGVLAQMWSAYPLGQSSHD